MKLPANFYRPLAIGAPLPLRELPVRPERMIHFFPPHVAGACSGGNDIRDRARRERMVGKGRQHVMQNRSIR